MNSNRAVRSYGRQQLASAAVNVNLVFKVFVGTCAFFIPVWGGGGGGGLIVGVLLAVCVIYHAVDMDLFAHVHGEDEREPAGAEVGARLDPANTQKDNSFTVIFK